MTRDEINELQAALDAAIERYRQIEAHRETIALLMEIQARDTAAAVQQLQAILAQVQAMQADPADWWKGSTAHD